MKLILTLDFPDESSEVTFYSQFAIALKEYTKQVAHNNSFQNVHTNVTELGSTKGPNKFISSNGIKLVEQVIE